MTEQEVIIMKVKPHWSMFIVPGILALFILLFSIATFPPLMLLSVVVLVPKILRYVSVELVISSKRLHGKNGILNSDELDTPINRVNDISVTTPFLGKIFHYGNIMIQAGTKTYSFACIGNPTTVRETILQAAEEFENAKFEKQTRQLVGATERQTQMQMQMMEQQPLQFTEQQPQTAVWQQTAEESVIRKMFPHALWYRECPILVSKCFIADKNANGDIVLNMELMNIVDKEIEAIYLDVQGCNVLKEERCFMKDIPILDLNMKPASRHMLVKPIDLPDNSIRQIKLYIRHVVFEDESIWNYDGEEPFYGVEVKQEGISSSCAPELDALSRKVTVHKYPGTRYRFYPVFDKDYWLCACGQFNLGFKCVSCDEDKDIIQTNFRKDLLEAEYEKRMEQEREEERLRQEEIKKRMEQEREEERLRQEQIRLQKEQEEAERLAREEERRKKVEKFQNTAKGIWDSAGKKSKEAGEKLSQAVVAAKESAENKMSEAAVRHENGEQGIPNESDIRFCVECGAKLSAGARFCVECGIRVE